MTQVVSIVNELVHAEETKESETLLGSVELWSNFEMDKVPIIKVKLKSLLKHCIKFYVLYISKFVNEKLRKYVRKFDFYYEEEPVLISHEVVEIFRRFKQEWKHLDLIDNEAAKAISPFAQIPTPELLEKSKKHGSIMLEMDMFSSRKKKIFSGIQVSRFSIFVAIALSTFKALCERIRRTRLSQKAFEQLHADISFMFKMTLSF